MHDQNLKPNTTLQGGKYRIERALGQGGFGITYRAITKETLSGKLGKIQIDVPVAIKEFFMPENCMRSANSSYVTVPTTGSKTLVEQYRKKFVKEANNLAGLSHPNIVQVVDIFQENGTDYYVMEYLEGGSLRDLVNKNGKVGEEQALNYIYPIGDALNYMHNKHMCHYDIKPSNIMLDKDGIPKLIDFGISKNYDSSGNQTSSTPIGISEGFAPIEQYKQSVQEFSPQTDIYALGATLYYLITGKVPPEASLVFNDGLPELPPSISASTRNAIEQAMQPRKKDRPQSMTAYLTMLQGINRVSNKLSSKDSVTLAMTKDDERTLLTNEVPSPKPHPVEKKPNLQKSESRINTYKENKKENRVDESYIVRSFASLKSELLRLCDYNNFTSPYDFEKVRIANNLSSELVSCREYNYPELLNISKEAINGLGIAISPEFLFSALSEMCKPQNFEEDHKITRANRVYPRILENKDNYKVLEKIWEEDLPFLYDKPYVPKKSKVEDPNDNKNVTTGKQPSPFRACLLYMIGIMVSIGIISSILTYLFG